MFTIYIYICRPGLLSTLFREHFCSGHQSLEMCKVEQSSEIKRLCSRPYIEYIYQSPTPASMNRSEKQVEKNVRVRGFGRVLSSSHDMSVTHVTWHQLWLPKDEVHIYMPAKIPAQVRLSPDHTLLRSYRKLIVARGERITVLERMWTLVGFPCSRR